MVLLNWSPRPVTVPLPVEDHRLVQRRRLVDLLTGESLSADEVPLGSYGARILTTTVKTPRK